jgi:alpha-galactosidase
MPRLRLLAEDKINQAAQHPNPGQANPDDPFWMPEQHLFSWQLLLQFGAFPAPLDRHVTEFFPQFFREGRYYGRTLGKDAFSFENTIAWGDQIYEEMKVCALSPAPLALDYFERLTGEHEQVLDIITAIRSDSGQVFSANLPNAGQVPNLPVGAVVESPAFATSNGLRPVLQPPLPTACAGILTARFQWVETVVEAALEGSRDKFIQALVLDGSVNSFDQAEKLADELIEAQSEFLPWY